MDGPSDPLDRASYFAGWSALHGSIDPYASPWVSGWLRVVHRVARPLAARRVSPDVVTLAGVLVGVLVAATAAPGGRWPLAGVVLVLVSGVLDGVDGAVAVMGDRATRWGRVLDPLADRCTDLLYLLALWFLGAPAALCVAVGTATLLQESARASAAAAGLRGPGVITVWERPSRVIVAVAVLLGAGAVPSRAENAAIVGIAVAAVLSAAGLVQLLPRLRRELRQLR